MIVYEKIKTKSASSERTQKKETKSIERTVGRLPERTLNSVDGGDEIREPQYHFVYLEYGLQRRFAYRSNLKCLPWLHYLLFPVSGRGIR